MLSPSPVTPKKMQGKGSWVPETHAGGKSKGNPESCDRGEEAAVGRRRGARGGGEGRGALSPQKGLDPQLLPARRPREGGLASLPSPPRPRIPPPFLLTPVLPIPPPPGLGLEVSAGVMSGSAESRAISQGPASCPNLLGKTYPSACPQALDLTSRPISAGTWGHRPTTSIPKGTAL